MAARSVRKEFTTSGINCIPFTKTFLITLGLFTKEWITFRKPFRNVIRTLSWFESLIFPFVNAKLFQIRLLKCEGKNSVSDRDPRRKPDSGEMWTQSSLETWFVRVHFVNYARWSHAWFNQRGLRSRNKILPRSAQILFVIGTAFAMLVNAYSSNHEPNQEADRDPKRLSEHDSFLCEQAHSRGAARFCLTRGGTVLLGNNFQLFKKKF